MTSSTRLIRRVVVSVAGVIAVAGVAGAQSAKPPAKTKANTRSSASASASAAAKSGAAKSLAGQWGGTVTVKLGDSTIVAPVFYSFVDSAGATTGTAMVPGQGTGPISNVVRAGDAVKFRVTAKQAEKIRLLEHDGKVGADGAMEGMVTLDNKPVAKFRIVPKK